MRNHFAKHCDYISRNELIYFAKYHILTLNMDMLRVFFDRSEKDTSIWFQDQAIWKCGDYYRSFQGKYPVIHLSFKDMKYETWENALKDMAANMKTEYARHAELADSAVCNHVEKEY